MYTKTTTKLVLSIYNCNLVLSGINHKYHLESERKRVTMKNDIVRKSPNICFLPSLIANDKKKTLIFVCYHVSEDDTCRTAEVLDTANPTSNLGSD